MRAAYVGARLLLLRGRVANAPARALVDDRQTRRAALETRMDGIAAPGQHVIRDAGTLLVRVRDLHAGELVAVIEARVLRSE